MRRPGTLLLALALAGFVLGTPAAAAADSGPTSSNPAAQAVLAAPPAAVELTFPAAPDPDFSHVSVLTADGTRTNSGALTRSAGRTLRQPVSIGSSGDVTIVYHVLFTDGGESTGTLRFSVGTGVPPAPLDSAARRAATAALDVHEHQVDPVSATLLVIDGLVAFGVLGLLYLRRPYRQAPPPVEPPMEPAARP